MFRNFMAVHILQHDKERTGLIVFDRATQGPTCPVLVRQTRDGCVQVAASKDGASVQAALAHAGRVFHLLDSSDGWTHGTASGLSPRDYFTLVTASPHKKLLKLARELRKEGKGAPRRVLYAPPSSLEEMLRVEKLVTDRRWTNDDVEHIVLQLGPVVRRLDDCRGAGGITAASDELADMATEWVGQHKMRLVECGIPDANTLSTIISDRLVIRHTRFDDDKLDAGNPNKLEPDSPRRFNLRAHPLDWSSRYVCALVSRAMFQEAREVLFRLAFETHEPHDIRGRLAENLMLTLVEAGTAAAEHRLPLKTKVKCIPGTGHGLNAACKLVPKLGRCAVLWMYPGDEEKAFNSAISLLLSATDHKPDAVLIRPYAHCYAGIDAVLVFIDSRGWIAVLVLQATLADEHPLKPGGLKQLQEWIELCNKHKKAAFHGLVYLLPPHRFKKWKHQEGVPVHVREVAWTIRSHQKK